VTTSLRFGFNRDFAPHAWCDNGAPRGRVIDRIARACADWRIDWIGLDQAELLPGLARGAIDAVAGTGIATARGELAFSTPIVASGGAWFVPRGRDWPDDAALAQGAGQGRRVATPRFGPLYETIGRRFPGLVPIDAAGYRDALAAALDGRAEAAALNAEVGWLQAERDYPRRFHEPRCRFVEIALALAVARERAAEILPRFNAALEALRASS
jgi:ABC-type amino acid transport substrate-binding protein